VDDVIALIDKIIEEHKTIFEDLQTLEQTANDAQAIVGLAKAKETYMPGRFDEKKGLEELGKLLEKMGGGIQAHFGREEGALLAAIEVHGNRNLTSTLHSLISEHKNLTERLDNTKQAITKLSKGGLTREMSEATGYDIRAYLNKTRKLFETHAKSEQGLLRNLRNELTGT